MKYFLFLIMIVFVSCDKDPSEPPDNDGSDATISYKVNDTLIEIKGFDINTAEYVYADKKLAGSFSPKIHYEILAQLGANNVLILTIVTDSLQTINYHYDSSFVVANPGISNEAVTFNGNVSGVFKKGDFVDMNINSYSNGLISGNFTGKMTILSSVLSGPVGTTNITEGKFKNVKMIY